MINTGDGREIAGEWLALGVLLAGACGDASGMRGDAARFRRDAECVAVSSCSLDGGRADAGAHDQLDNSRDAADAALTGEAHAMVCTEVAWDAGGAGDDRYLADGSTQQDLEACSVGTRKCRGYATQEVARIGLNESPAYDADYASGRYERVVSINNNQCPVASPMYGGNWLITYQVSTSRPSVGELYVTGARPMGIAPTTTDLSAVFHRHVFPCAHGPFDEPDYWFQFVARDLAGNLLMSGGYVPLQRDGSVIFAQDDVPELQLTWSDVGCASCTGEYSSQQIELRVQERGMGSAEGILAGERATVMIRGESFTLMSQTSDRPTASTCGSVSWSLVRTDFWVSR